MDELKFDIKRGFGKYSSLDKAYRRFINNYLSNCDDNEMERWETYSNIINEIINLDKLDYFEEIKYRTTGGENINQIMLDTINKDSETKQFLKKYLKTINFYIDIDFMKKFI